MDEKALSSFRTLCEIDAEEFNRQHQLDQMQAISTLVSRGLHGGTASYRMLSELVRKQIVPRTALIRNTMFRVLTAHGIPITSDNATEIKDVVISEIRRQFQTMESLYLSKVGSEGGAQNFTDSNRKILDGEITRTRVEIDLIAEAAPMRNPRDSNSTFVFNGPVGVVQSGESNFAQNTQTLGADANEALRAALHLVLQHRDDIENARGGSAEVVELAEESLSELAKEKPNGLKLKSAIVGVAQAIEFVPKVESAYTSLKHAASLLGITLP
ncbi:hypothetical protein [Rhizobium oryzicola]|uniref:Uncharacterized protein n=1 Tax=Rhizobium oryzicola TaxID=1232668 RepID=A0ABT8SWP4_9HYPH|nr:hypothetical protein [Rhizobium oryzicola]MDO1582453.1 hypothetical protein [Rhizobium oryzicola]